MTADELAKAKATADADAARAGGRPIGARSGASAEIVRFDLPDDYYARSRRTCARAQALPDVATAASDVQPDKLVWVVVGDRAKIEAGIRELGFGTVKIIDADGNVLP